MKVIDLLNKIANGEEKPKKIKLLSDNEMYEYNYDFDYIGENGDGLFGECLANAMDIKKFLNDEVEIIEENNKKEKLDTIKKLNSWIVGVGRVDERNIEEYIHKLYRQQFEMFNKLNEIIDKINGGNNE